MRRIKVLRVVIGLNQGGVQQGVFNLCRGLDPERFEPIACAIENSGAIGNDIEAAGFEVIVLGYKRQFWQTVLALVSLMRERKIDIVHASSYHPSLYARLAAFIARVPVILGYEHVKFDNKRKQRVLVNKLLLPITNGFTSVGQTVADQVSDWYGYPRNKVHIIHNGVDTERFKPVKSRRQAKLGLGLDPDKPVVGYVSRLNQEKGHRFLFDAIAELSQKYDIQWLVVGEGREQKLIHQQAQERAVLEKIIFTGIRRDIPEMLSAFDVHVFPTLQEGFPNVLLEAMSAGCANVTSDFPGNLEIAKHQHNALIVPMGNAKALAQSIEKLILDEPLAERLRQQARQDIVQNFSLQAYADKMSALYMSLLKQQGVNID